MPIRETFWNIPQWAEIGQYILALLTFLVFTYGILRRVWRWRKGVSERRTDQIGKRFGSLIVHGLGQLRTLRDVYPGIMHLTIFWGIVALLIGTALATVDWDVTHLFFDFQFLTGAFYVGYEIVLDIFGVFLIIGLVMAIYRRYFVRPERLQGFPEKNLVRDDAYTLIVLSLIAISGYLVEGLRIAVTQPEWARWSPVGNALASVFVATGDPTNQTLHVVLWISHIVISFSILASLPFTKLFHVFAAPINIFFRSLEPAGTIPEARYNSGPGVEEWRQFTWKQVLDFESCTRCGRCQDMCPAHSSGAVLSPRDAIIKLESHLWEKENGRSLHGDVITADELWACTTCLGCVSVCPVFIDHLWTFVDMRRYLVDEGEIDTQLQDALANLGRYGNSFGQSERMRARWTKDFEPKIKDARNEPVEYLWFVGDYASYHASLTDVTRKTAEVFQKAGLDFGILYDGERNSGNDARRAGEEGLYEMMVEDNVEVLSNCDYKSIVTTDPHSYNTLKNEYPPEINNDKPILHYSELLDQLITSGQLRLNTPLDYKVTYHDPCYLGRYNGVYDPPRRVLQATGCRLIEMTRHADTAYCCGAGGGRIWMDEIEVEERPSESRINEAVGLDDVGVFVVSCPKDVTMYQDAVKTTGKEEQLVVMDLIELVHEAM
ncbi:MAG: 4Fe-4S dicluster domain-containing protein [Anaerolineales bacterium]|nr:4Fe-4S dicluster domain-containing protein [Anaerolineales bacterium]